MQGESLIQYHLQWMAYKQQKMQAAGCICLSLSPHYCMLVKAHEGKPKVMINELDTQLKPKAKMGKLELLM